MYVCSHYKFYSVFWFQCTSKGNEHPQYVHSTRSSEPLFLSHVLHRVILQHITALLWSQRLNSLYSVGVRSSTTFSLANILHMNMKPTGYFNYTLHRCSRFVFVFDKRAFMSLLLAEFQEMKELQSLTWCSGIVVVEEVGRPVLSKILHRCLFVLCLWFTLLVWRKDCGIKGCIQ